MYIHFVIHEAFEAPGAYLEWARLRKHRIGFSKVYQLEPLPDKPDEIDMLVVMGGPQSPATTIQECPHFDAKAEIKLIQQCTQLGKIVIGVCLGAQLIGEAFGAKHERSPEKEIGVFPITLTDDGLSDDKINHFGKTLPVGHWHGDMPGLPAESKIIAVSDGCPRQIVAYADLVYGLQCHMEFNSEVIELLIESEQDIIELSETHTFIQHPDEIREYDFKEMNEKLFGFLDRISEEYEKTM